VSPPHAEDIPARKKPRLEDLILPTTTEEATLLERLIHQTFR
jgi:hypothetical protein